MCLRTRQSHGDRTGTVVSELGVSSRKVRQFTSRPLRPHASRAIVCKVLHQSCIAGEPIRLNAADFSL